VTVYDDFAHHPTAIATTLQGLRAHVGTQRIVAVIEPRSNTMRMGQHRHQLLQSCQQADKVVWLQPAQMDWNLSDLINAENGDTGISVEGMAVFETTVEIIEYLEAELLAGDHVVIMSNGGFDGLHGRLLTALDQRSGG